MDMGYTILIALIASYLICGGVLYLRARGIEPADEE